MSLSFWGEGGRRVKSIIIPMCAGLGFKLYVTFIRVRIPNDLYRFPRNNVRSCLVHYYCYTTIHSARTHTFANGTLTFVCVYVHMGPHNGSVATDYLSAHIPSGRHVYVCVCVPTSRDRRYDDKINVDGHKKSSSPPQPSQLQQQQPF